jgi:hypothetical protein
MKPDVIEKPEVVLSGAGRGERGIRTVVAESGPGCVCEKSGGFRRAAID